MIKILLIEDNNDVRENIAEILSLSNYEVLTAEDGRAGVQLAQQHIPDLIVCDIMMPELDGHEVLHLLSRNEDTAAIPFIFLTARAERDDIRRGIEMGADDYITKPFKSMELLHAIEARLKKKEILRKQFSRSVNGVDDFLKEAKGLESLKQFTEQRDIREYRKKDEIFREGAYARGIYFVAKGKVKICRKSSQGKELITALHKEGDFFGYLSLLRDEPYAHSAIALEDAEILIIPREEFFTLIYRNADVSRKFIELITGDAAENEQLLLQQAYHSVRKRVAEALIRLSDKYKDNADERFSMKIAREDLAGLAGTALESVIRTLSEFKDEQSISISGSTITILEYDKLKTMRN